MNAETDFCYNRMGTYYLTRYGRGRHDSSGHLNDTPAYAPPPATGVAVGTAEDRR